MRNQNPVIVSEDRREDPGSIEAGRFPDAADFSVQTTIGTYGYYPFSRLTECMDSRVSEEESQFPNSFLALIMRRLV